MPKVDQRRKKTFSPTTEGSGCEYTYLNDNLSALETYPLTHQTYSM